MKKFIYFLFIGAPLCAQVGIGTTNPETKLDILTGENSFGIQHSNKIIKLRTFIGRHSSNGNSNSAWIGTTSSHALDFMTTGRFRMRIGNSGNVGIGTYKPERIFHVRAMNAPIRVENLESIEGGLNTNSDILSIDNAGDIRKIPLNNMLGGKTTLTLVNRSDNSTYVAKGNESVIWCAGLNNRLLLQVPKDDQVGKTIHIVASGGDINLSGTLPTITNGMKVVRIPEGKRITIFAIKKNVWGNDENEWCVISKDF